MVAIIAVTVVVPMMIVGTPAVIAFPVAFKKALSIVVRRHPIRAGIWRTGPITVMPFVMPSDRIPVALDPHKTGAGDWWPNTNDAWGRRRPNGHTNGYLGEKRASGEKCQREQFLFHGEN
jgi:hypothetical protein